jgi:hypothetical protein
MGVVYGASFGVDAYLQGRLATQQAIIQTEQASIDKL